MRMPTRLLGAAVMCLALVPTFASAQAPGSPAGAARDAADSVGDGIGKGALIGAGAAIGLTAVQFARCKAGCEAPAPGPIYLMAAGIGGGAGAVVGWLIDRAHKGRPPAAISSLRVAPIVTKHRRGVAFAVRF